MSENVIFVAQPFWRRAREVTDATNLPSYRLDMCVNIANRNYGMDCVNRQAAMWGHREEQRLLSIYRIFAGA